MKPNSAGPPPHKTSTGRGPASRARKHPRTMQNVPSPTNPRLDAASHSRVLIPRLERREVAARPQRSRVSRACNNCRTRRTKCSGEQPRCKECQANGLPCVYEQSRKDRLQE
ncbi:hypothetical protein BS50DRAFT_224240 [Corynespora cassiicola Philippines]|uniref:Zn(2)-C6 fungal-type domain-containing protein n=1 Tax=Corynespora cassiicola Philippines TaxID=1448308 RepID=A0A2T2N2W1_CORCC|nr:hypothetical protein BS50DRAFT_224240 [Corynespora cassiicola Philippines]